MKQTAKKNKMKFALIYKYLGNDQNLAIADCM